MKHGVAFRKLSRTSSHRMLMLRNMVSSLIEHEQIQTTVAKAKEAARYAEKLITLGKKGEASHRSSAQSMVITPTLLSKVFGPLADRYRDRPGGYTRILRYGNRPGDNAPKAILELVDGPRDTKFQLTARKVGWEVMGWKQQGVHPELYQGIEAGVESIDIGGKTDFLKPITRSDIEKVFKYRPKADKETFGITAANYLNKLLVEDVAKSVSEKRRVEKRDADKQEGKNEGAVRHQEKRIWNTVWNKAPGQIDAGSPDSSLRLAKGLLGKRRPWQLQRQKTGWSPLEISALKRYRDPKIIRVKTVEITTAKKMKDGKAERTPKVTIEEGRRRKDMPARMRAPTPNVQRVLQY